MQADAGEIVFAFGNFVVGGNLVVGMVIFLILTIVQFIVVTKGAERVAEVSARFSLDAMPGKQLSIDSDMRAGLIDIEEARKRRFMLEKESQLFGSMDGAMKFVKGDAIAGIIIVAVNLLGGITIGIVQPGFVGIGGGAHLFYFDHWRWLDWTNPRPLHCHHGGGDCDTRHGRKLARFGQ